MTIPGHLSDLPHRSEEDQAGFFADVLNLARDAERRSGALSRDILLLDRRIRLIFAGDALEPLLLPALAHRLVPAEGKPDLIIHAWDSRTTGVEMCPAPVRRHCFSDRGDIWSFHSTRFRSAFHWSEYSISLLDCEEGEGVFWLRSEEGLPYWTQASPFRTILHWWSERLNAQLVHAAAVGTAEGGVLITGRGGVGKSTTALACLKAGFDYAGDDYVLLAGGDEVVAHSLYCTAKLNPDNVEPFADFAPRILGARGEADYEKAVIFLDPGQVADRLPIRAVLTPAFADEDGGMSRIEPVDPALLIGAATFTTMAQLPHAGQNTADFIETQLARLPGRRLVLGGDPAEAPSVIEGFLKSLGGASNEEQAAPRHSERPLVSVIIPVYNGAHFLGEAVESVLAQGYPKVEILVVDDGSVDAIVDAVEALPVQVRLIRKANEGPAAARNVGLRGASGPLIAFLDVDDLWPLGKLEASMAWLRENPEADAVIGAAQLMEQRADGRFSFVGSPGGGFIHYIGAALYRRSAFERNGGFDPLLRFGEDLDWFARAERNGLRVDRLDMITLRVRRHAANSTRGLDGIELTPLRLVRNALEAKRDNSPQQDAASGS